MNRIFFILWFCFITIGVFSQKLTVHVVNHDTKEPIAGAMIIVQPGNQIGTSNEGGDAVFVLKPSSYSVEVRLLSYESSNTSIDLFADQTLVIELEEHDEHLEEIVISSTRSSRTFEDIPTRVEFISGEELEEKANMKPGDIRMLLSESTGIQTQQTSATSANSSIRIQGLDGRYTQILKDGFPLYAGFAGGLGLLQTPPLDLKQVEVIKGSSSTLYGGGAIAGLVNLISRTPSEEGELRFFINGTSALGLDLNTFYSKQFGKVGLTTYAARNSARAYDPSDVGFSAIPEYTRYTFNPRLFFPLGKTVKGNFGINYTTEERHGGDMEVIDGNPDALHQFFEMNDTERLTMQLSLSKTLNEFNTLNLKASSNLFDRKIQIPEYLFHGRQQAAFAEINFVHIHGRHEWIIGMNLWLDDFKETSPVANKRDFSQNTIGFFAQNNWQASEYVVLETGLRVDKVTDYKNIFLPRISLLYKPTPTFSTRVGGGLGYKAPTIFSEETERRYFVNVPPLNDDVQLETSYGVNADLNYRRSITDDVTVSINHMFFYTYIEEPVMLNTEVPSRFENILGFIDTKGTETNLKVEFGDFKLFVGYTYTDTRIRNNGVSARNPLTPVHRMNNVLMYEKHEAWKLGLEAYYFSRQRLNDGTVGKSYWICGFMAEKLWENFSVFINFENFLDARQTRFDTIYNGPVNQPVFRDIYAPLDGFVINGGLKVNLGL